MSNYDAAAVIAAMQKTGWDGVLNASQNLADADRGRDPRQELLDLANLVRRVYETDDGRVLFDWMVANTILRPDLDLRGSKEANIEAIQAQGWMRAGKKELVRDLLRLVGQSHTETPSSQPPQETDNGRRKRQPAKRKRPAKRK